MKPEDLNNSPWDLPTSLLAPERREPSTIEELYRHLSAHVEKEGELLSGYQELADSPETPDAARYLINIVVKDEERHHRLFHEMAAAIASGIYGAQQPGVSVVPSLPAGPVPRDLLDITTRFLAAERADQRELRALRKELRPYRNSNLWALLVELMVHDTAKHILLLNYIRDHIAKRDK